MTEDLEEISWIGVLWYVYIYIEVLAKQWLVLLGVIMHMVIQH